MAPDEELTRPPGRSDQELRALVRRRVGELRFRRRAGSLGAAATALVLVAAAILGTGLANGGPDRRQVLRTAQAPTTSSTPLPATAAGPGEVTTSTSPSGPPAPTTTAVAASPSTTPQPAPPPTAGTPPPAPPLCRNSHDPVCGPFVFDPSPDPDRPMTVEVTVSPPTVRLGQEVVFHIVRRDADGVSNGLISFDFGDGGTHGDPILKACDRFGPWDPPPKNQTPAVVTEDVRHTYIFADTFSPTFAYGPPPPSCTDSRTGRGDEPYASAGQGSVQVTVVP